MDAAAFAPLCCSDDDDAAPVLDGEAQSCAQRAIVIESVPLNAVMEGDHTLYNTTNHWDARGPPGDYKERMALHNTQHWVDQFHLQYHVVNIRPHDVTWMYPASNVGKSTGRFPSLYAEELDDFARRYAPVTDRWFAAEPRGFFVRLENVSLKTGMHGAGPYRSMRQVAESICTCSFRHTPIDDTTGSLKVYLLPWIDGFDRDREMRVFVRGGRVNAVSQQALYDVNSTLQRMDERAREETVRGWLSKLLKYHEEVIRPRMHPMDSYCVDFALLGQADEPYFIEVNPFGREYSSGSALYHWITDGDLLYGADESAPLTFRWTRAPDAVPADQQ